LTCTQGRFVMVNLYGYIDWPVVRGWVQEGGISERRRCDYAEGFLLVQI
jgi:hypothetical protein